MADKYSSFAALAKKTQEGTHWRVVSRDRPSTILIAAPHGGRAEPNTAEIARAIAGTRHSLYVFDALVPGLHVTSHRFKEPRAVAQAARHSIVLTVHGCANHRKPLVDVFVGGMDMAARNRVITELQRVGVRAGVDTFTPGRAANNLCNGGTSGAGIQLEITQRLRRRLNRPSDGKRELRTFARAVRRAIEGKTA
jgi:phage replication-related protein YjqB (UPF0714/DUF867 family)